MTVIRQYNFGTEEWDVILIGEQGAPGVDGADGAPSTVPGPPGPIGAGLAIRGAYYGTSTPLPNTPATGDLYILGPPLPTLAPDRLDATAKQNGDGMAWSGTAWINTGPVVGPRGFLGPAGPAGTTVAGFVYTDEADTRPDNDMVFWIPDPYTLGDPFNAVAGDVVLRTTPDVVSGLNGIAKLWQGTAVEYEALTPTSDTLLRDRMSLNVSDPKVKFRTATGWFDPLTGIDTPIRFPIRDSVGVDGISGWEPAITITDDNMRVLTPGAVIEDVLIVNGGFLIEAPNVTLRRCKSIDGVFKNQNGSQIENGLLMEDCTLQKADPLGGPLPLNAAVWGAGYR